MVPARFALFTALFAGLLLAVALEGLWRRGRGGGGSWPSPPPWCARLPGPVGASQARGGGHAAVLHQLGGGALPRDEVALVVPFPQKGRANQAMLWQAEAGMWFKMPGGYFVGPGPDGATLREAPPSTTSLTLDHIQRAGAPPT